MLLLSSAFFQVNFFNKILSGTLSECPTVCIQIRMNFLSKLFTTVIRTQQKSPPARKELRHHNSLVLKMRKMSLTCCLELLCLFIAALWPPAGKGLTSWFLLVMLNVFLLLSHEVSWVRCGT